MKYWLRMGGPNGITFRAWLILSPISIIFTWVVLPEGYAPTANIWNGFLVGFIAHSVTGIVLFIAKYTVLRNVARKPRPITSLVAMATAGVARGWSAAYFLELLGLTEQADYADRMLAGSLIVLIWFSISAVMVDGERKYKASYQALMEELELQTRIRNEQAQQLKENQARLMDEIRNTLSDALRAGRTAGDIHDSVETLIRPLAHRLAGTSTFSQRTEKIPGRRIKLGPVIQTALNQTPYSPLWTILMSVLATLYSKLWQFGLPALLDSVLSAIIIWLFFTLAKGWKLFGVWVVPVWLITGLVVSVVTAFLSGNLSPEGLPAVIYLAINVAVPAAIVASIGAFDRNTDKNLSVLREIANDVSWQASSLEQRAWVEQQRLARFVHSELQGRLRAFALRLDVSGRLPTEEEIEKLRLECEAAFPIESQQKNFEEFLEKNSELWEGVVIIRTDISPEVFAALANDSYASTAAEEICRESVVNAVRHGKAKNISIRAEIESSQEDKLIVSIVIEDDGVGFQEVQRNMGLTEIEQLSISSELLRADNRTILKTRITCAANLVSQN